jgi:hypothetical protein
VAAPRAGGSIQRARRAEERFVLDLLERLGGPAPTACGLAPWSSDADARLLVAEDAEAALRARQGTKKTRAAR